MPMEEPALKEQGSRWEPDPTLRVNETVASVMYIYISWIVLFLSELELRK
jgi:hypothetical protein